MSMSLNMAGIQHTPTESQHVPQVMAPRVEIVDYGVAALELPDLQTRLIDVDPEGDAKQMAASLAAELAAGAADGLPHGGWDRARVDDQRSAQPVTQVSEPLSMTDPASDTNCQSYPAGCKVSSRMPKWLPSLASVPG